MVEEFYTYQAENTGGIDLGECYTVLEAYDTPSYEGETIRASAVKRLETSARILYAYPVVLPAIHAPGGIYRPTALAVTGSVYFCVAYAGAGRLCRLERAVMFAALLVPPPGWHGAVTPDAYVLGASVKPSGCDHVFLSATVACAGRAGAASSPPPYVL